MVQNTISTILSVNRFSPGVTDRSVMSCALPLPKPKALLADKGYDGDRFRENLLLRGILPIIPPRSNRKAPTHPDYRRHKDRNRIDRMFGKLKQQRRVATQSDKTVLSFESFLNLAVARIWLKSFVNAA